MEKILPYSGDIKYKDSLSRKHILAYAFGHFANDLILQIWYSYSTLYLTSVIELPVHSAGTIVLITQITDAISQPIVSYLSDNTDTSYIKRYPWYLLGNLILFIMAYAVFNPPEISIGKNEDDPKP